MKRQGSKAPAHEELKLFLRESIKELKTRPRQDRDALVAVLRGVLAELRIISRALQAMSGAPRQEKSFMRAGRCVRSRSKIARNEVARELTIKLLRQGYSYEEIVEQLREQLNFLTTDSSMSRFVRALILGQLPESKLW